MCAKFEVLKNTNTEQFYWHLKADNGEIIARGETYVSKQGCMDTVNLIKTVASTAPIVDLT
ncbi:MAG: YegP family protein [Candidatus Bathyarchaeota archaeon]|nr:YegP family protein [Candidatus Bathyarchaeota archaeon]